jgi:hypothetical protein
MSYLNPEIRAELLADLEAKEEALAAARTAYLEALERPEEYWFNSGDGRQHVKNRSLRQLGEAVQRLENQVDTLRRKLRGGSLVNIRLRRRLP